VSHLVTSDEGTLQLSRLKAHDLLACFAHGPASLSVAPGRPS
jgi:hypothetical protein